MHHELLSDIPLIIGFSKKINLLSVLDKVLSVHGNQKGLSNAQVVLVWLSHILTQNNHCKSPVNDWVSKHKLALEVSLNIKISETDFDDMKLSRLLNKFADDNTWKMLESLFYKDSFSILDLSTNVPEYFKENPSSTNEIRMAIKVDSTTAYGHHEVTKNGIMQRGWSKDHRPDLPQVKMMVSVEGNTGLQIASNVVSGNQNDDPLYIPILEDTRKIIDTKNSLICGDSKMSAISIRADIVKNNELYLSPLQLNDAVKKLHEELTEKIVDGDQQAELIWDIDENNKATLIGAGFEISRSLSYELNNKEKLEWNERILLVRSTVHAQNEILKFDKKIEKFNDTLSKFESKLCDTEEKSKLDFLKKFEEINNDKNINFFEYKIETVIEIDKKKIKNKKKDSIEEAFVNRKRYRTVIVEVCERTDLLNIQRHRLGWRLYVTNAKKEHLTFSSAYRYYRKTMYVIEIGFHALKDYINISPLFVRNEKQILGMTRLLILALKILTLMTAYIRKNMKKENIVLKGLYAGQPARKHPAPTAQC
nr:transposase [Nitrosopumilus sp.]